MTSRTKSLLFNGLRISVCALGVWFIYRQLTGADLTQALGQMDLRWVAVATVIWAPIYLICSARLVVMMATQDIKIGFWEAVKLTYAGGFLNFAMPGATGGDVYKAYFVARGTDRKTEAVMAVFLDRVVGLTSLVLIGGVMSLLGWVLRLDVGWAAQVIGGLLVAIIIGSALFFSHTVRRWVRYDRILARLPLSDQIRRIDQAVFILRKQKRKVALALLMTFTLQVIAIVAMVFVAVALDMKTDNLVAYFIYLPLGMVIRAVPISIQGIGPMDGSYKLFFVDTGFGNDVQVQILALSVRIFDLLWALPGGLVILTGRELPPKEFAEEAHDVKPVETKVLEQPRQ